MVNKVFKEQIGQTMEVYVDDILVKSLRSSDRVQHLSETLDHLRKYKVKLNLEKCTFDLPSEKFVGYLVTQRGIEANPDLVSAIFDMRSPTCVKKVQILNERLATLIRFLSCSIDKCKPFFQAIKKSKANFCCNKECEAAFQGLKYMASPL